MFHGEDGSEVTASADAGFRFIGWSDGVQTESRIDDNITSDFSVSAQFEWIPVITTEQRDSTTQNSERFTFTSTEYEGEEGKEDTLITTSVVDTITDSLWSITDTLTDDVVTSSSRAVFVSETKRDTVISTETVRNEYIPTITTEQRDSTVRVSEQFTFITTEYIGEAGREDTLITTTVVDTVIDSLWTIVDTLTDDEVTSSSAPLFVSETTAENEVSSESETREYQEPIAIIDHGIIHIPSEAGITVGPNPVQISDGEVHIVVNAESVGSSCRILIFDNLGNLIDEQIEAAQLSGSAHHFSWDLRNRFGQAVSSGAYRVIAEITATDSSVERIGTMIGVQE